MIKLSKRLQAIADLVSPCHTAADIGCDHGYLAIYLIEHKIAEHVYATDIKAGPLQSAEMHILEAGLKNCIDTIQCDGLEGVRAESIIIAGMGGNLMLQILSDQPAAVADAQTLILQPQSELSLFRKGLAKLGLKIIAEDFVIEDEKYYPMMKVCKGHMQLTDVEALYGPVLLEKRNASLKTFLLQQNRYLKELQESLSAKDSERSRERMSSLLQELAWNEEALGIWQQ